MAKGHYPLYLWTLELLDIQPADWVLDLGCGSGKSTSLIAEKAVDGFVAGIDHSVSMVKEARSRNRDSIRAGRIAIRQADVSTLPYEDETFDRACAIETFYFWPEPLQSLTEILRVMKPGGLLAITMEGSNEAGPNRATAVDWARRFDFTLYSGSDVTNLMQEAGFGRAWFVMAQEEGAGWVCALGIK